MLITVSWIVNGKHHFLLKNYNFRKLSGNRTKSVFFTTVEHPLGHNTYFQEGVSFLREFWKSSIFTQNIRFFLSFENLSKYSHFCRKNPVSCWIYQKAPHFAQKDCFWKFAENQENQSFFIIFNSLSLMKFHVLSRTLKIYILTKKYLLFQGFEKAFGISPFFDVKSCCLLVSTKNTIHFEKFRSKRSS